MKFKHLVLLLITIIVFLTVLVYFQCTKHYIDKNKPYILCTTSIIADAVRNIAGDTVQVVALMGPGIDPHLYKPVETDVIKIASADIIFYNGLHLEAKMADLFKNLASKKTTVAISKDIDASMLLAVDDYNEIFDPHIWFDINLWITAINTISKVLIQKYSKHATIYHDNSKDYGAKLNKLLEQTKKIMQTVPKNKRIVITGHDAFSYFGRVYDCQVVSLQGISTESSPGVYDIAKIIQIICKNNIPAIFVESSIPIKNIIAIQQGVAAYGKHIAIGGQLYSDALGGKNSSGADYMTMILHNVKTIAHALQSC